MNRRSVLTGIAILGLATVALPTATLAQSASPLIGTWQLNLAKSKYTSPAPKSQTLNYTQDGQNIKLSGQNVDAQGKTSPTASMHIYDGQSRPATFPDGDAVAYLRTGDSKTIIFSRSKGGKLVVIGSGVVSQDGKTFTVTTTDVNGTDVAVYEKQ